MINNRDSFRLRKHVDVTWSVPEQQIEGEGKIYNISTSGMSFETDRLFDPDHGMVLCFKVAHVPSFPPKGKLVRFRKVGQDKNHYHCGVRFLKDSAFNPEWVKWIEDNVSKFAGTEDSKILGRYLNEGQGL